MPKSPVVSGQRTRRSSTHCWRAYYAGRPAPDLAEQPSDCPRPGGPLPSMSVGSGIRLEPSVRALPLQHLSLAIDVASRVLGSGCCVGRASSRLPSSALAAVGSRLVWWRCRLHRQACSAAAARVTPETLFPPRGTTLGIGAQPKKLWRQKVGKNSRWVIPPVASSSIAHTRGPGAAHQLLRPRAG